MVMRAIAGVGVVLCLAITSFSIYLGIAENAFSHPKTVDTAWVMTIGNARQRLCLEYQQPSRTATTVSAAKSVSCSAGHATH